MRISLEQALNILMDHVTHGKTERKTLEDCLGLVLSEDVYALLDMPPFSRSAQDGYALCSKDSIGATGENPVKLKVTGKIYAGDHLDVQVIAGGNGDGGAGADDALPGDVVNAIVQLIGILRLKAPEHHEHAARQARPQTGAVAFFELALKRGAALQPANMRKPEAFKLIGECGLKAFGAACVKFHG